MLHQVNSTRSRLTGINKSPIPAGTVSTHPNGSMSVAAAGGRQYELRPNGSLAAYSTHGTTASFKADGQVRSLRSAGLDVTHGAQGQSVVVARLPDRRVVVSTSRHSGYVERATTLHGHDVIQRTYVANGHVYARVYDRYRFHGLEFHHFVPVFYYDPMFYGWAFYPWPAPIVYAWGWGGDPWVGFYGPYFAVWPRYPGAAFWLTDYVIASTLQDAYEARMEARAEAHWEASSQYVGPPQGEESPDEAYAPAPTPITPELKQAIAEEVQRQISYENAASQHREEASTLTDLPQVLQPNRLFIVNTPLNVITADGQTCSLSGGDVLRLLARPDEGATTANLTVASNQQGDCPAETQVNVALEDLEEMQNTFRAQIDDGLKKLHDEQGRNDLPAAPPSAIGPEPRPSDYGMANADPNAAALVDQTRRQAAATEQRVEQSAFAPSTGNQTPGNQ